MKIRTLTNCVFPAADADNMKDKVLSWLQQFGTFCFLDNHQYQFSPNTVECLAAAGCTGIMAENLEELGALSSLNGTGGKKWLFGHLGYDLKNKLEGLSSSHPDGIGFSDLFFFEPEIVIRLSSSGMEITAPDAAAVYKAILRQPILTEAVTHHDVHIQQRISRDEYIHIIRRLKQHILRGDCYEINFCQEFFAEQTVIDPVEIYRKLCSVSPNPFSALYRLDGRWLICASPERFLHRKGDRILSQPIKGTAKRVPEDLLADERYRDELFLSAKDRSENVMVVDLVRNDLARICEEGSVQVDELYGIYSFPQVHQMISTISGRLRKDAGFTDIIRATFPMGSMTGAPKRRVMELIEQYERTRRGIFSGAVGYIDPNGDFDFNVVIRSLLYNSTAAYLSYQAGSGITFYSDPEMEWEECLLKAAAIRKVLEL